ncbi:MAG TPA: outer membrane beta-barrel protein, partial [Chitinophagaceae bacterium]|nr:outer membrane beta-barrel protein [Chitinophagaceae bacterium]
MLGASIKDVVTDETNTSGDLSTPNFFSTSNIIVAYPSNSNTVGAIEPTYIHNQLQSVFANVDLSYSDWAFLTLTGRNDWSSNLSFTPNVSYFYPSAGLSFILSRIIHLPEAISFAKVRASYAQVGNTVPAYLTHVQNTQSGAGQLNFNTEQSFRTLKPEKTKSWEFGTEWNFFKSRLHLGITYYKTNTFNQYIPVIPPVASLISTGYVNAGNIQNQGIEFIVGGDVIKHPDFKWHTSINGSSNQSEIIEVDPEDGIDRFMLTDGGNSYQSRIQKGGAFGDIYGRTFKRDDQGRIVFSGSGTTADPYIPLTNDEFGYIGNPTPDFQIGWGNTLSYKNFNLYLLFSGRFGGEVLSMTQLVTDLYGVSERSGEARANGGVSVNGVDQNGNPISKVDAESWYKTTGGRQGISEAGVHDATVVRLRSLSLGYTFNLENSVFKDLSLAITGRNLFYIYREAPFDPEITMSTGNGLSGVELFSYPAIRNVGIKLDVTF